VALDRGGSGLITNLQRDRATWLGEDFAGHFSLAGTQAKTALIHDESRWGRPSGPTPTTHVLKPQGAGFADQDLNEHVCLAAARNAGLVTARSEIVTFGDVRSLSIERYDRRRVGRRRSARVHQEDACQALGVHPASKYENLGGPGVAVIARLLRRVMPPREAERAIWQFADGLIWNWLIAGTDAHAKNQGLLLSGAQVRFAPLYDITSILPYLGQRLSDGEVIHERRLKMAMRIGGEYDIWPERNTWVRAAKDLGLQADALQERVRALAGSVPSAFGAAAADPSVQRLRSAVVENLVARVRERASRCLAALRP
jgi:serine/threonine-protein kinase HipA